MEIFTFILTLIKIFFQIIFIIILFLLLILLTMIFSNIKLKIAGNNQNLEKSTEKFREQQSNMFINLKISYLFGIITFIFDNTNNIQVLKIFGFKIDKIQYIFEKGNQDKNNKINNKINKSSKKFNKIKNKNLDEENSIELNIEPNIEADFDNIDNIDNADDIDDISNFNFNDNQDISSENLNDDYSNDYSTYTNSNDNSKKGRFTRFSNGFKTKIVNIQAILDKIKLVFNYPDKTEIIKSVSDALKSLFGAIKFEKIKIDAEYGLGEPYETGVLAGIISSVLPIISDTHYETINLNPNFEEQVFSGDFEVECKTTIFKLGYPVIKFILNSPIKQLLSNKRNSKTKK